MNAELAIVDILLEDTTVSGIVEDRVFMDDVPQTQTLPYVVVEESDVEPHDSSDGESAVDRGRIRVFPYTKDKASLRTLALAIRQAIERKGAGTYRTINFSNARFLNESSFSEEIENREVFAKDQEYEVRVIR
jgi:hypothetical protein